MSRQDEFIQERLKKLEALKKEGINPYTTRSERTHTASELQSSYKSLKNAEITKDKAVVAGRVLTIRDMGKIAFATLSDGSASLQLVFQEGETPSAVKEFFKLYIDTGDFIDASGVIARTQRGELSLMVREVKLLTKSMLPLPEKFHGLQDDDERLRKRYLELISNNETKQLFIKKSIFWNTMRSFLLERDFLEVETPVLETSAGGAAAQPFKTHHNALDLDVYLRISMGELWQKKLMVAGYPKTFEIGRQFRNEGMDAEHLQDYSQMEFYWAYVNYEEGMNLVEALYKKVAQATFGKTEFTHNDLTFDLNKQWKKIDYATTVFNETGIDIFTASAKEMEKKLKELKEEYVPHAPRARLIDVLWKHCRRKITGPVFLTGQPVEVSPLAKRDPKDSRKVQQFQIILAGTECGNGYSELNDPFDQENRFKEQQTMKEQGDNEAQSHDADFVEALKYGMPPTCGFGVSERLFSILAGKPIRECVLFPLMRQQIKTDKKELKEENNGRSHHKK